MNRLAWLWATWFGCGLWPWGPGTAGSLAALALAWAASRVDGVAPWHLAALAMLLLAPSIAAATRTAEMSGKKDPSIVVVDEVLGQWMTLAGAGAWTWPQLLAAFVLFRMFDITKPWPVRQFERLPGGTGIVADDIMAGVYGAVVLGAARWFNLL